MVTNRALAVQFAANESLRTRARACVRACVRALASKCAQAHVKKFFWSKIKKKNIFFSKIKKKKKKCAQKSKKKFFDQKIKKNFFYQKVKKYIFFSFFDQLWKKNVKNYNMVTNRALAVQFAANESLRTRVRARACVRVRACAYVRARACVKKKFYQKIKKNFFSFFDQKIKKNNK